MVNESLSGFERGGSWDKVVEHGEMVTEVLKDEELGEEKIADWDEWRPKRDEELRGEMAEKTAEKVSVEPDGSDLSGRAKKLFGAFERAVYSMVMGKAGPLYFDSELISANIDRKGPFLRRDEFSLEIDIHDGKLRRKVRRSLT